MLNVQAARILGLVALIAAGGCGSGPGPGSPTIPTPAASTPSAPATLPPVAAPASTSNTATEVDPLGPLFVPPRPSPAGAVKKAQPWVRQAIPGFRRPFDIPLRVPAVATGDPELDPLVSYLKAAFAVAIKEGHQLVIDDTTDVEMLHFKEPYQRLVDRLLEQASDQVPAAMIRDFGEKNRKSRVVWPELSRHLPVSLLTLEERKGFFGGGSIDEGWNRFYAKYPGSPGIITVSRVGLDSDKPLALFYVAVGQASLLGYGQLHVLKKEGEVWIELAVELESWTA